MSTTTLTDAARAALVKHATAGSRIKGVTVRDLRVNRDPRGTLTIGYSPSGQGYTPLGLPGQTAATFTDDVVITNFALAGPDHIGMTLRFERGRHL